PTGGSPRQAPPHARDGPLVPRRIDCRPALDGGARRARRGDRLPPSLLRRPRRVRRVERLPVRRRPAVHELGLGAAQAPRARGARHPRPPPRRLDARGPRGGGRRRRLRRAGGGPAGPRAALAGRPETRLGSESDARVPRLVDQASGVPRPAKPARQTAPNAGASAGVVGPEAAMTGGPVYSGAT